MKDKDFIKHIKKIREDARQHLKRGPVTENYGLDLKYVHDLLNSALATELICSLRYRKHYYQAAALGASVAAGEFLEHANQETDHANQIAQRIVQLGGEPDFSPNGLSERSHSDYVDCPDIECMVKENLIAERIAIDIYREMVHKIGNADPTTRHLLEGILAVEEEHADDLLDLAAEYKISLD
ncbi:bacterioferritin [Legionella israelensis]|uniref:Bacterioferritin n=1 Tax=Legionella israelensis TaxID=454 RepID=A0A0W0WSM8_9GAMM|nr:ferritin-like domain-containing protein [Legionella israelensis]KTD35126.1 DNA protection during starvation protein [Legionella israelensis]QBR84438.1 bacterioferritin [Legionella israelensis]QBS08717.1 bacterioferritin [Legionella israelensis]QDP72453.1 bacterioferritin [Legionella israelensis]SCY01461.1 bacterioferritin [Legionella israelensis DSM 19235]